MNDSRFTGVTYFCPACERNVRLLDPCVHVLIEPDALEYLRAGNPIAKAPPLLPVTPVDLSDRSPEVLVRMIRQICSTRVNGGVSDRCLAVVEICALLGVDWTRLAPVELQSSEPEPGHYWAVFGGELVIATCFELAAEFDGDRDFRWLLPGDEDVHPTYAFQLVAGPLQPPEVV